MRPRVFPAENIIVRGVDPIREAASMRPRVFPAENTAMWVSPGTACRLCFNEAAGIPRGKPEKAARETFAGFQLQ